MALCALAPLAARAQTAKEINEQAQFWWSVNTTSRFTDRWGLVGDLHIRRNDFIQDPSFYLLRAGAHYWVTGTLAVTLGYAHNWLAPAQEGGQTWTDENRIYQQVQYATTLGRVRVLHRIRNEQRWQEEVEDDVLTGNTRFSNRVRYLFSLQVPLSGALRAPIRPVARHLGRDPVPVRTCDRGQHVRPEPALPGPQEGPWRGRGASTSDTCSSTSRRPAVTCTT
jgi:hypothetical protein